MHVASGYIGVNEKATSGWLFAAPRPDMRAQILYLCNHNLPFMITTFRLPADELDLGILKAIKEAFKGRNVEIIISDTTEAATTDDLVKRIENLRKNKNTVLFEEKSFFKTYRKKIADASN
jgi:hypothetical protein